MLTFLPLAAALLPAVLALPNPIGGADEVAVYPRGEPLLEVDVGLQERAAAKTSAKKTSSAKAAAATKTAAAGAAKTTAAAGGATAAATATGAVAATGTGKAGGAAAMSSVAGGSGVGGTTCTVTAYAAVSSAVASCSNILLSDMSLPASSVLSVTVPSGGALLFAGTMTVDYTPQSSFTPIVVAGSNAKVAGLAGAVIDGLGSKYWDGKGSNGGSAKPDHLIKVGLKDSTFEQLTIRNWPTHLFEITSASNLVMSNMILDNKAGASLGHNTDAFDVSSTTGLTVSDVTVYNQDDCVAVNSGSNMVFQNMYCDGGHGLSIGSIKSSVTVSNITFQSNTVTNSQNACRIKTTSGGTGSTVSDITYKNIAVSNISKYAIDVQQDYLNGGPTGTPTTGITVSNVVFDTVTGSVSDSSAYDYYILCGSTSSCSGLTFTNINLSGGTSSCSPSSLCSGA